MNAIDLLKRQHREVDQLFAQFERAHDAPNSKSAIFELITDSLAVHQAIEEQIFYPAARYRKTEASIDKSRREHTEVKRLAESVLTENPNDPAYNQKAFQLRDLLKQHITEQEEALFPTVVTQLGRLKLMQLGEQMEGLIQKLTAEAEAMERSKASVPPSGGSSASGSETPGVEGVTEVDAEVLSVSDSEGGEEPGPGVDVESESQPESTAETDAERPDTERPPTTPPITH
jgi:iron-sulfur cluster repair protein YtfE (RIC family)